MGDYVLTYGIEKGYIEIYEKNGIEYIKYNYQGKEYKLDKRERIRARIFIELIKDYRYPPKNIRLDEYPPSGKTNKPCDIVVYDNNGYPFMVVKIKEEKCAEKEVAIEELFKEANSFDVRWAVLVCEDIKLAYFSLSNFSMDREPQLRRHDIPKAYGKLGKFIYGNKVGFPLVPFKDISEFQRIIKKCHDILRDNENLSPIQAFPVISRIIYIKIYDELHTPEGEYYQFQVGVNEDEITLSTRISILYREAVANEPEVFSPHLGIEKPQTILEIVKLLQGYSFYRTPHDVKGEAYQVFLSKLMRGELGQYFTPREVVKPTVEMLAPEENEKIIDPCCGTGGFLIYTLKYLRNKIKSKYKDEKMRIRKEYDIAHYNIYGIEIDKNVAEACIAGMLLEDDAHGNIAITDALSHWNNPLFVRKGIEKEKFHVLMTNPPFGKKARLKEYRDRFILGKEYETPPFEALILERALELLVPGGRLAIIIPDVNLTDKKLLNFVWNNAVILGVVSLPSETFSPYGSNAKTSVLFLRKKRTREEATKRIFMAKINQIGYDATGRKKGDGRNYYEDIVEYFHKFLNGESIKPIVNDKFIVFTLEGELVLRAKESLKVESYIPYISPKRRSDIVIKYVPLKEVARVYRGYTPRWHEYVDNGIPILKVRNLTNKAIEFNFERRGYVTEDIYRRHPEAHVKLHDILVVASAHRPEYIAKKVDIIDIMPFEKCMAVAELLIIRPKENIDPFYLLAVLRTNEVNEQFRSCIKGTTAHIYPRDIEERVLIPRLLPEKEKEIAESLKAALKAYREFERKFANYKELVKKYLE